MASFQQRHIVVSRGLRWSASVVALAAALGLCELAATAGSGEDFLVAIQTPGAIVPIARYANGTWNTVWGDSDGDIDDRLPTIADVPVAWLGQPIPPHWSTQLNPQGRHEVAVTGLERQGCEGPAYIVVRPATRAPRGAIDTMHFGLATAPARTTLPIVRESTIQPLSNIRAAATRAALTLGGSKPVLHWLLRAAGSTRDVFFFETRERPLKGSYDTGIVGGWIHVSGGHAKALYTWKACGNEETDSLPCVIPIGVIPFEDHDIWVLERPIGETGRFELWRIDDHEPRKILDFDAGGC